jgi:murein hydrolase activator
MFRRLRLRHLIIALATFAAATADAGPGQGSRDPAPAKAFERLLEGLEEREKRLEQEIAELEPRIEVTHRRMLARGRAYYRMVRAGLLPVGGGFDALVDHAAAMERLRSALGRDLELETKMKARLAAAKEELGRTRAERAPLTIQKEAMERAQSVMQQADERRAAFLRAFGGGASLSDTAVYGTSTPSGSPLEPFSRLKGRLPLPVTGRSEIMRHPGGIFKHGIVVVASRDSDVRAVHPGQVTFAGHTAYGQTVVLHHGEGYLSIYARLHHVEVKKGEMVQERGRLGWVLRMADQSPSLYFEVRRGDETLDAAAWLGL